MKHFEITDEMRQWCEDHRDDLEAEYLTDRDYVAVEFCNHFNTEWNFDVRWWDDAMQMYVWSVCWMTVVVDWNVWRDTAEEFLDTVEVMENWIYKKNEEFRKGGM